jgi:hypothetical protein
MHDRWLTCYAASVGTVDYVDKPLMLYRQHSNNVVGGLPFGLKGMISRIRKDASGSLKYYLSSRLRRRIELISSLPYFDGSEFLLSYYSSGRMLKLMFLPKYIFLLLTRARCLGVKNIISDCFLTVLSGVSSEG